MARSKVVHSVQKVLTLEQPNDSNQWTFSDENIDLALELSKKFGRTIRQGNVFRVVGANAALITPQNAQVDVDLGFAVSCQASYVPATSHNRRGWNQIFKAWSAQKRNAMASGSNVRYDDMEFAFSNTGINSRTSSMMAGTATSTNIYTDSAAESLVLIGSSQSGSHISLQDLVSNMNLPSLPSISPLGVTIKAPKYTSLWSGTENLHFGAATSAMTDQGSTPDSFGGGTYQSGWTFLPNQHLNVMCGLINFSGVVIPPDTTAQVADTLRLVVTFYVEGWSSLVYKRKKARRYKKTMKMAPRRRYYTKRKRTYRKTRR